MSIRLSTLICNGKTSYRLVSLPLNNTKRNSGRRLSIAKVWEDEETGELIDPILDIPPRMEQDKIA